jgi:hypothetical protein
MADDQWVTIFFVYLTRTKVMEEIKNKDDL